jgi:hypothetical protein
MNQNFRRGFLYALAGRGLTPTEFGELVVKTAALRKRASYWGLPAAAGDAGLAALLGVPIAAGVGLGATAAYATRPDYEDTVHSLKQKEVADQLRLNARKLRRHQLLSAGGAAPPRQQLRDLSVHANQFLPDATATATL